MAQANFGSCKSRSDKVNFYRQALTINLSVWVMQLIVILFVADSLTLLGDWSHGLADILILFATHQIFASELQNPDDDHSNKKKWLVRVAVLVLWTMAGYIFYEAAERTTNPVDFPGWPVAVLALLSATGNFLAHKIIGRVAKCEHDDAHRVNVAHLLTDAVISLTVFVSALGMIIFGLPAIDTLLGIIVGIWMILLGWKILSGKSAH